MELKEWVLTACAGVAGWIANIVAGRIMSKLDKIDEKIESVITQNSVHEEKISQLERRIAKLEKQN